MKTDIASIERVIEDYFKGSYQGNEEQLRSAFHADARVTGFIQGNYYDLSLGEFIARTVTKPTQAEKNIPYNKHMIAIDLAHSVASVKCQVQVEMLLFTDYLTLLKIDGKWLIRNKCFVG